MLGLVLLAAAPAGAATHGRPTARDAAARGCGAVAARRSVAPILALDPRRRAPRVFAIQFKQDAANVRTYATFRRKVECTIRTQVLPHLAHGPRTSSCWTRTSGS